MVVDGSEPSAIYQWVATNGQIVYFFAQLAFWVLVGLAAVWATVMYTRYVDFMTGGRKSAEDTKTSVDEFVE